METRSGGSRWRAEHLAKAVICSLLFRDKAPQLRLCVIVCSMSGEGFFWGQGRRPGSARAWVWGRGVALGVWTGLQSPCVTTH